jgi:hypothetical protein
MPVCWGKQLIGVLALYSATPFSPEDEQSCRAMVDEIIASADASVNIAQPVLALKAAG